MASLGDMVVRIRGDMTDFNKAIDASEKQFKATAANFQKIGANMTKFVTVPLLAAGAGFLKLADTQVQAEAALANAIRATGKEASISVANLSKFAGELQKITKFGDEAQLSALALVQQLADLNEDGLKAVLPGILNFSTAMGVDLQTAASLVGKTLGSSTNALARYGVEVDATAGPTEKLAQLTEALEKRFGGAAEAAAKAGLGPLVQLKNSAGDLGEEFGKILIPGVIKLTNTLKGFVDRLNDLDTPTKKSIIQYGLLAASIGPVILGVLKLIELGPKLITVLTTLAAHPVVATMILLGATIAALAVNINKAQDQFKILDNVMKGNSTGDLAEDLKIVNKELEELLAKKGASSGLFEDENKELDDQIAKVQEVRRGLAEKNRWAAMNVRGQIEMNKKIDAEVLSQDEITKAIEARAKVTERYLGARSKVLNVLDAEKTEYQKIQEQIEELQKTPWASGKLEDDRLAAIQILRDKQKAILEAQLEQELYNIATTKAAQDQANAARLSEDFQVWQIQENFRKKLHQDELDRINAEYKLKKSREVEWQALYKLGLTQTLNGFADIGAAAVDGELSWKTFAKAALNSLASVLDALGAQLAALAAIAFFGFPPRPTAGVGNSLGAAAAFTAAGAVRASAVALADGGVVMPKPGGTLAQIAEAGQPEAVIPLDRLGEMGGDIHLTVQLDSKPFLEKIFPATRNRQILISAGAVV